MEVFSWNESVVFGKKKKRMRTVPPTSSVSHRGTEGCSKSHDDVSWQLFRGPYPLPSEKDWHPCQPAISWKHRLLRLHRRQKGGKKKNGSGPPGSGHAASPIQLGDLVPTVWPTSAAQLVSPFQPGHVTSILIATLPLIQGGDTRASRSAAPGQTGPSRC